jgi:hypothetical protein
MLIHDFISSSFDSTRSSERTDRLHKAIVELLLIARPELKELDIQYEYKYPDAYGNTFKVDIAFFNSDGSCRLVVLDKALNSCVQKNIKNYGNCTLGESARLMFAESPPEEILFVTLAARVTPKFTRDGDVTGFDNAEKDITKTNTQPILDIQYDGKIKVCYIFYDIIDVREKKAKDEFIPCSFENVIIPRL